MPQICGGQQRYVSNGVFPITLSNIHIIQSYIARQATPVVWGRRGLHFESLRSSNIAKYYRSPVTLNTVHKGYYINNINATMNQGLKGSPIKM